jgi:tetratricopeptide (TPR) repeat protein
MGRLFGLFALGFLLILHSGGLSPAQAQGRQAATLISVRGATVIRRAETAALVNAFRKMVLAAGDALRTGPDGRAALLLFADRSQVKVNANSILQLRSTPPPLFLSRGEVYMRVNRGRRMGIETPAGVRALVHGTELNLKVDDDETVTLTVAEGEVQFSTPQGTVTVRENEQSIARLGQKPTLPVAVNVPFIIQWINDVQPVVLLLERSFLSQDPARLKAAQVQVEALPPGLDRLQLQGDVHHDRGELDEARRAYEAAREQLGPGGDPQHRAAIAARIGQTWLELGKTPEAEASVRESLALDPAATAARAGLVMTLLSRRENELALAEAEAAVGREPESPLAHTVQALVLIRLGRREQAQGSLDRALALDPQFAQAHAWRSFLWRSAERLDEAERSARRAVDLAPFSSLARQSLSDAAFALGQIPAARAEAEQAVRLNPLSPGAHVSLGRALLQQGDISGAIREANEAVALDPELDRVRFFRGVVLAEQRRLDQAAAELEAAIRLDPGYLEARAFLARVYLEQGRRSAADQVVREAVARDPRFAPARAVLGRVYWRGGQLPEAAAEYEAALALAPGSALYHLDLAQVYLDQNRLADALAQGMAAVGAAPRSSEAHAILGLIYDRMDNREQAVREYREALALSADNALARFGFGLAILRRSNEGTLLESAQAARRDPFIDGLRETVQAALRDPFVFARVFKPGVTTEIAPVAGSEQRRTLGLTHRDQYLRGKLHDLSFFSQRWSDNYRNDRAEKDTLFTPSFTAAPDYRTHLLGNYIYAGEERPLPGGTFNPDADDRMYGTLSVWTLAARRQLSPATFGWLSAVHSLVRGGVQNLDAPLDGGLTASGRLRRSQLWTEGRLDHHWGSRHTSTYTLSAGWEKANGWLRGYEPLTAAFQQTQLLRRPRRVEHTLQHDYRSGKNAALLLGVTHERLAETGQLQLADQPALPRPDRAETSWLPFGQATYVFSGRDLVRAIAYRRVQAPFDFILQPTEAFLLGEFPPVPGPGPLQEQITRYTNLELDYEHRFSPRDFAKLFLFRSIVDVLNITPAVTQSLDSLGHTVPKARMEGIGVRYERQIGRFLSSYLRYTYTELTDRTSGATHGRQLPMNPRSRASLGLNYVDRSGTKLFTEISWRDAMYIDPLWSDREGFDPFLPRPTFPHRLLVNLRFAKERTVRREWVLRVNNLFNAETLYWPGYPAPGRSVELEYRVRF